MLVKKIAALAALYLIWGSTYLAIRFAIETIPPFLMGATRFLIAGALLYAAMRVRGAPAPTRVHWRAAAMVGALLPFGGNGGVILAEQSIPSGIAALMIATLPMWMVLLNWWRGERVQPTAQIVGGIVLGLSGIALLVGPASFAGANNFDPIGIGLLLLASLSWAIGSIYSRRANLPANPLLATGMEMLVGGAFFLFVSLFAGEWGRIHLDAWSARSSLALVYLTFIGSMVAYSAYVWLLRVATPALASTYAFVNPIVAVLLGWALAGEPLTLSILIAAAMIIAAVALITLNPTVAPAANASPIAAPGATSD